MGSLGDPAFRVSLFYQFFIGKIYWHNNIGQYFIGPILLAQYFIDPMKCLNIRFLGLFCHFRDLGPTNFVLIEFFKSTIDPQ